MKFPWYLQECELCDVVLTACGMHTCCEREVSAISKDTFFIIFYDMNYLKIAIKGS